MNSRMKFSTIYGLIATSFCIAAAIRFAAAQDPAAQSPQMPQLPPEVAAALKPVPQAAPAAGDDELTKLRKERYQAACTESGARLEGFQAGTAQGTIDILLECTTKRLLAADIALSERPADHLAAYGRALVVLKFTEWVNETRFRAGRIPIQDLLQTRFERLSVEIKILETKRATLAPAGK